MARLNPPLSVRLGCWLTVYFGSQVPLYVERLVPLQRAWEIAWSFPLGLLRFLPVRIDLGFYGVYVLYLAHLALSLWSDRKVFGHLMAVLIAVCALSLAGCQETLRALKAHPPLWDYSDVGGDTDPGPLHWP